MTAPFDRILVIDFETYYDSREYTLRKMTTEEYVRDPRFKAFGLCVKEVGGKQPTKWIRGEDIPAWADGIDWSRTAVLAHNAQFDVTILSWRYGIQPAFILDTLSMARAVRGVEGGNSLAQIAADFGLPEKGKAIHKTDGVLELLPAIEAELADYCAHDVYLCEQIFLTLSKGYPKSELRLIDLTLKMYTRPLLELDQDMLTDALHTEREQRESLLKRLDVEEADLASNPKFAEILKRLGVAPPMKKKKPTVKTPNPEGSTFAFAKNDALFQALLNSENEDIALLCEARLKVKSTTERTRAQRFLDISKRGRLPVPLSYYGALSGRWTAAKGSSINMQNLKRGSFLRSAIMAPEGYVLGVGDLSQIEPRVLAWLADYEDMLAIFRAKGDAYAMFGAQMFNIPGMTKESHSDLRQSAKSALLGCLSGDTPVLTNSGYKPMLEIQLTDLLWDGCDWVPHQGLLHKGEKETWTHNGLTATADHKVLVGDTWREWQEVLTNPSLFRQALFSATSPVLNGDNANLPAGTVSMPLGCDVPVGMRGSQTKECFYPEKPNSAGIAKIAPQNPRSGTALKNHSRSVLASVWGSLPVLSGRVEARPFNRLCVARAAGRGLLPDIVYSEAPQRGAIAALKEKLWRHVGNRKATTQFAQIGTTVTDCWTGLVQSLLGARTQTVQRIQITAGAVSQSILSGWEIASRFFATLWDCKAGTSPSYNWTASTTTEGMSRETCDLSHAASTWPTSEKSLHEKSWNFNAGLNPLKQRMQTYDIAFAGPRNRYTVLTSNGPIIVHNCGYGLGWASFSTQLLTGFLGAPPIRYDKTIAKKLGVTSDYIERFIDWEENILRMQEIPHTCSTKDLLIHCIAAKKIIELYRAAAHPVAGFWKLCESLIQRSLADGEEYRHKCLVFRKEEIVLPNGMSLRYPNIRQQKDARGRPRWVYGPDATSIYGEKVTNNVTQGVARVVMTDGMLRTAKRYPVAGTVHDEQIIVVPASESKEALAWMLEQMTLEPSYMPGIPLAAEGGVHRRYGLAKK